MLGSLVMVFLLIVITVMGVYKRTLKTLGREEMGMGGVG